MYNKKYFTKDLIMTTPLNASASTAGSLIAKSIFEIPQFQREYAWKKEEVNEFWSDLETNLKNESYFLGLIILTEEKNIRHVVDGQQRLLTLTLLATAIYHKAKELDRNALADRIDADFLNSIDYDTDKISPRVNLSDSSENKILKQILKGNYTDTSNSKLLDSYKLLYNNLNNNIKSDPFKILGIWAKFITDKLYFAVFIHPDSSSAYKVFEVINTRGVELTTADLLKNYILSQFPKDKQQEIYENWQYISKQIESLGEQSFVQYIRHVVNSYRGYILPKDLYDFLAQRTTYKTKESMSPNKLIELLNTNLPYYMQIMDPRQEGPAEEEELEIFSTLNALSVITIRPLLLSIATTPNAIEGMRYLLKLVVRRMVAGSLGTGNVERKLVESAKLIRESGRWEDMIDELAELNPTEESFQNQIENKQFSKKTLTVIRHSILENTITPKINGILHQIRPQKVEINTWTGFDTVQASYYVGTLANCYLMKINKRDPLAVNWSGFVDTMIDQGIDSEIKNELLNIPNWNHIELVKISKLLSMKAVNVWYQ